MIDPGKSRYLAIGSWIGVDQFEQLLDDRVHHTTLIFRSALIVTLANQERSRLVTVKA